MSQSGKPFEARFDARVTFNPARPEAARAETTVDTASFASGDRYEVEADLEPRGVARPLTHTATITAGGREARATGEVELARLDWQVGRDQPRDADAGTVVTVRSDLAAAPAGG